MARFGRFGLLLGLVCGTLFGVLFAPNKGKDLRDRMKADRAKGKHGLTPLGDDIKHLGKQIASLAQDLYETDSVQEVVEKGRKKVKKLHDSLVDEVADFHYSKINPMRREVNTKVSFVKTEIKRGKRAVKAARKKAKQAVNKAKRSAKKKYRNWRKSGNDDKKGNG